MNNELLQTEQATDYRHPININSESNVIDIANKLHQLNIKSINDTLELLNEYAIHNIVQLLTNANNIYFYGLGLSGLIAIEGKYKFMRIGMRVDACTDEHTLLINAALVTSSDLIIAVSNSGESTILLEAVAKAQRNNANIVTITKYPNATINKYATEVLLNCGLDDGLEIGSSTIKTSQVFIIDLLYNAYLFARQEKGTELSWLKATKQAFTNKTIRC